MEPDYEFSWNLEPEEAGLLVADGAMATIEWAEGYLGNAILTYQVSNTCGASKDSQPLEICEKNSTELGENTVARFKIFPNPATNQVNISGEGLDHGKVTIRIIDVMGRIVMETQGTSISTSKLSKGVYEMQITVDGNTQISPLLIK